MNNRIIKFRAWTVLDGRGEFIFFPIYRTGEFDWSIFDVEPIFQQFTGLLDNNGKEIYEGDIIQEFPDCSDKSVITWSENGLWYALSLDSESGMGNELFMYPKCQVIDNIFENPSLLSQKVLDELNVKA